ncbi:MAG: hypothetical protein R2818_00140 [Flavobacteriales bacterium]
MRPLAYFILTVFGCLVLRCAAAQTIDSVHVFQRVVSSGFNSASANAQAWRSHREGAKYRVLLGPQMVEVEAALEQYRPTTHVYGPLADLGYLAMAFSGGRPFAMGVTKDLDRVINFTARKEYRISTWAEHLVVRALLAKLLLDESLSLP